MDFSQDGRAMMEYEQHELGRLVPAPTQEEFAALCLSIAANGLRDPIITYQEKILDGWSRCRACREVGVEPRFVEFTGTRAEAIELVLDKNLMRRHLSEDQRAAVAADLATLA